MFADVRERENEKEQAGKKYDTERRLPRHATPKNNGIREIGVEGHARSESDGVVGPQPHDERGGGGGNASGKQHALNRHARFSEDTRVDDDNVGHRHERSKPCEQLAPHSGLIFFKMKCAQEQAVFPQIKMCATIGRQRRDVNGRSEEVVLSCALRRRNSQL